MGWYFAQFVIVSFLSWYWNKEFDTPSIFLNKIWEKGDKTIFLHSFIELRVITVIIRIEEKTSSWLEFLLIFMDFKIKRNEFLRIY